VWQISLEKFYYYKGFRTSILFLKDARFNLGSQFINTWVAKEIHSRSKCWVHCDCLGSANHITSCLQRTIRAVSFMKTPVSLQTGQNLFGYLCCTGASSMILFFTTPYLHLLTPVSPRREEAIPSVCLDAPIENGVSWMTRSEIGIRRPKGSFAQWMCIKSRQFPIICSDITPAWRNTAVIYSNDHSTYNGLHHRSYYRQAY